ncbi:MAG: hypothetical protein CSA32_03880 [Desulfobulbus propionicus]|nr:MAG: hypothetical protein CSA32_03880 [Desulfobulbus propionicus]
MMFTAPPIGCVVQVGLGDLLEIKASLEMKTGFADLFFVAYSALQACRGKRFPVTFLVAPLAYHRLAVVATQ